MELILTSDFPNCASQEVLETLEAEKGMRVAWIAPSFAHSDLAGIPRSAKHRFGLRRGQTDSPGVVPSQGDYEGIKSQGCDFLPGLSASVRGAGKWFRA